MKDNIEFLKENDMIIIKDDKIELTQKGYVYLFLSSQFIIHASVKLIASILNRGEKK